MTRRLAIVNLSNWENEDFVITQGDDTKTLAPGEHANLNAYPVETKTITITPVENPEAEAKYTDPAASLIDLRGVKPTGHSGNRMVKWFASDHLGPELAPVVDLCRLLAERMDEHLPEGPEKTTGLRKLKEAKDCFVCAVIEGEEGK